jgi:cullin 3
LRLPASHIALPYFDSLPPPILQCCTAFEEFYFARHSGRKLTWQAALGTADVRANFPTGRRELNVSTYQMCILMLFNDADTLSLAAIRQATQIQEAELRRHLLSLCTPKHRILNKASKGKGITDDDTFSFNAEYTSKLRRVRVPLISSKESEVHEQGAAVPAPVEEDRRHLVEACVVRIMKARKQLTHNELVAEATRQLSHRFVPPPQFIRKRIESLIEREYLERDATDRCVFSPAPSWLFRT